MRGLQRRRPLRYGVQQPTAEVRLRDASANAEGEFFALISMPSCQATCLVPGTEEDQRDGHDQRQGQGGHGLRRSREGSG